MAFRFAFAALLACAFLPALCNPSAAADRRIYKVDSVIATSKAKGRIVVVQAKGAVSTGGWRQGRLHLLHNDGKTLTLEFLAAPPPPEMTVIEQLVPITASAEIRTRRPVGSVHVVADANEVTTQVLH
ncbi:MAG TPA: hypothetical protein VFS01_08915 [Rhizomicrobium sp.]|jgi:hypothetical protein|nr:hypothetical protein [Rhizomicrobium sp.]